MHTRPALETTARRALFIGGALVLACAITGGALALEAFNAYTRSPAPKETPAS
jgi:hypothetical protein